MSGGRERLVVSGKDRANGNETVECMQRKQGCIFLVYKRDGFVNALERLESVFVLRDLCVCVYVYTDWVVCVDGEICVCL